MLVKRQLGLTLVLSAVLLKYWPAENWPAVNQTPGPVTICGLRLGMTRAQVIQKLGLPARELDSDLFRNFKTARYKDAREFEADPEVIYSPEGRVISLTGHSLEWSGGSLTASKSLKQLQRYFPEAIELQRANYHPGREGEYFCLDRALLISTEVTGLFSADRFDQAQLAVPYFFTWRVKPAEFKNQLIFETAARIRGPNHSQLLRCQAIGCYHCYRVLRLKPKWTQPRTANEEKTGICPYCEQDTLLGGSSGQITPTYLKQVHQAWLEP